MWNVSWNDRSPVHQCVLQWKQQLTTDKPVSSMVSELFYYKLSVQDKHFILLKLCSFNNLTSAHNVTILYCNHTWVLFCYKLSVQNKHFTLLWVMDILASTRIVRVKGPALSDRVMLWWWRAWYICNWFQFDPNFSLFLIIMWNFCTVI